MSILELPDIQRTVPQHAIPIDWVGIRGLRYPIQLELRSGAQATVGDFSLAVGLTKEQRGTHMSRFVEALRPLRERVTSEELLSTASTLANRLASDSASVELTFPFFLDREAPISGIHAPVDYEGRITGTVGPLGPTLVVGVRVPVTSLCPCSKEISDYGAHSQRGYVTIEATGRGDQLPGTLMLDLADLVAFAEQAASAPIYSLLKRIDERHVTMQAFDQPAFVEDLVRAVASELSSDPRVSSFVVDVENHESIHNHAAWARVAASAG